MEVENKVAIVTGASSGIGLATAKLLSKKGAKVVLVARSTEKINSLSKKLPDSMPVTADMTHEDEIKEMIQKVMDHYGRIDILVNNAGRGYDATIEAIDPEKFRELFQLNILAPVIAMQQVIPIMKKQKSGAIINISSGTSLMKLPGMSAYSSLKRALNGISFTAQEELADTGIKVSVIYPYITDTNFEKNMIDSYSALEDEGSGHDRDLPKPDSADYVAHKIVEAIETGKSEIYAHDWMSKLS